MNELPSNTAPPNSSKKRKRLVMLVITLGVLLVAGFAVMVGTIIYRITNKDSQQNDAQAVVDDATVEAAISVLRPDGAELIGATSSGNRLTLHFKEAGDSDLVLLVDLVSGQVISRVQIAAQR